VTSSLDAISGAHHNNDNLTSTQASVADTIANSYRFLAGIKGLEDDDWEWDSVGHNEYFGRNDTSTERDDDTTDTYTYTDTISFFCAECHGYFHSRIDSDATFGSPWVRHPTDIVLPDDCATTKVFCEYNDDNGDGVPGQYSMTIPVARPVVPASSSSTVTPGDDTTANGAIVMCLSCHRAHGSEFDDLLRFDYTQVTVGAGDGTMVGCFVCHTDKN
jgi:predicted CXXCH cytochrome family protein